VPQIARLEESLVDQIAAGEVVERPASVVKELVENALDAGARRVDVTLEGGGTTRLSVTDDGCGMTPDDALLAMERHATSKIRSFADLSAIGTLGFRGEALPSIASVSRLTLATSPDDSGLGTEVIAERGAPPSARPVRSPRGTRVVVQDLFGNVPARRKFLKGAEAEVRAALRSLTALALARPEVSFTFESGGRRLLDLPQVPDARARFQELLGGALREAALPLDASLSGMRLSGAVTPPSVTYASRASQWLFVNGRPVKDATAAHAAALAAREELTDGRHPGFVLFLECSGEACDVNVHPQKFEVRFKEPATVHALVHRTLGAALRTGKGAVPLRGSSLVARPAPPFAAPAGAARVSAVAEALAVYGELVGDAAETAVARAYPAPVPSPSPAGPLALLGQYRDSFLVAEGAEGLVLVDQHAAHERVRLERIEAHLAEGRAESQRFLLPVSFQATADEAALLSRASELLAGAGFVVSELSGGTFHVSAAPPECPAGAVVPFLRDLLATLAETPDGAPAPRLRDALAASLACRGAITVHTRLAPAEAARLLADLARCRDPFTCAHGRPTMLTFGHPELVRRFGRSR
jgi:DNA mismatch repair protein MutL